MSLALAATFLAILPCVVGFSTFTPNCTASNVTVNYVADTGRRSTLDILWSSLFTIIACTWTILHLNVPEQRNGRDPGFWGDTKWALKEVGRNFRWMILTILAPEWTLGLAGGRLLDALAFKRKFKEMAMMDGVEFTLTHAFYSGMGGFAIRVNLPYQIGQSLVRENEEVEVNTKENIPPFDADSEPREAEPKRTVNLTLTAEALYALRKKGYIRKLPDLTAEKINDKSKSDVFTKIISVSQVFSSITQILVRYSKKLPISQLELVVCAFSVCAVVIYFLILYQPKGIKVVEVICNDGKILSLEKASSICRPGREHNIRNITYYRNGGFDSGLSHLDGGGENEYSIAILAVLASAIFGGIHCCGWFFTFPTPQELLIWRTCSIITMILPIFISTLTFLDLPSTGSEETIRIITWAALVFIYVLARLCITVEVFRSLFYLPPGAFISTWVKNMPQVS